MLLSGSELQREVEAVGVAAHGEAFAPLLESVFAQDGVDKWRVDVFLAYRLAHGIEDVRQVVVHAVSVFAGAVGANNYGLVLDCACDEQMFPGICASLGPVGRNHEHVIFICHAAAPYGKTEVVAHDEGDVPASEADYRFGRESLAHGSAFGA